MDVLFCEASAKAAVNVSQMFNKLCYSLPGMEATAGGGRQHGFTLQNTGAKDGPAGKSGEGKKKGCC